MKAENKTYVIASHPADNDDIIFGIEKMFPKACEQVKQGNFADKFRGGSPIETASNIWDYLKYKCLYKVDGFDQVIALPAKLVNDNLKSPPVGHDCKSYALFAASIMRVLYPNAKVCFRYVSFKSSDATPTHVYCVVKESSGTIIIDGVYTRFNTEKPYKHKIDHCMRVIAMAGIGNNPKVITNWAELIAMRDSLPYGSPQRESINNHIRGIGATDNRMAAVNLLKDRSDLTPQQKVSFIGWIMGQVVYKNGDPRIIAVKAIELVPAGLTPQQKVAIIGSIMGVANTSATTWFGKLFGAGMTAAGAVPRTAFLKLVSLNVFGLASRLKLAIQKDEAKVKQFWNVGGGNYTKLKEKVLHGATKRPILPGQAGRDAYGIGVEPVTTTAVTLSSIIATATPIIVAITTFLSSLGIGENDGVNNPLLVNPDAPITPTFLNNIKALIEDTLPGIPVEIKYAGIAAGAYFLLAEMKIIPKLF